MKLARGRTLSLVVLVAALAVQAQTPAPSSGSANVVSVPAGEKVVLELQDSLHTRHSEEGDTTRFLVERAVRVGRRLAIPRGSTVRATITEVERPGRLRGRAKIRMRFDEIELPDGTRLPFEGKIRRAGFRDVDNDGDESGLRGEGNAGRDAANVGINAASGALFGAAVGGKKGAAYGGAIGAGIGLLGLLLERGPELSLPPGMLFEVELQQALAVPDQSASQFVRRRTTPRPGSTGAFNFPDPNTRPQADEPEIPDFESGSEESKETSGEQTTEVASNQPPGSTRPTSVGPQPPPPTLDPTLGDPEGFKIRVDVQLVLVEAFVRDERGRPMDRLTREDFRLFEEGVEQKIRHFSRDELPLAVALVVDRSNSVAPYMSELRRAAYETLQRLKPEDQVALFSFSTGVRRLESLTTDRRRIAERISRIRPGGGTNILDALFDASYYLSVAAPNRRRAIILISDNEGTIKGNASQDDVVRMALEYGTVIYSIETPGDNRGGNIFGIPMPTITFGTGDVGDITEDTGGEIIDVERTGSLRAALAEVVSRLKTRYTLGYHSNNPERTGFRKIDVRLVDRFGRQGDDYRVHARKGYYPPESQVARQQDDPPAEDE